MERTQLIEMALNNFEAGSDKRITLHDIEHDVNKIDSALGLDAVVKQRLNELRAFITTLKHPGNNISRRQVEGSP